MSNRFADALAIQAGACNPSGIARTLVAACDAARAEGLGTDGVRNDPAVRLIVHQLAFLCRTSEIDDSLMLYGDLTSACRARAAAPNTESAS